MNFSKENLFKRQQSTRWEEYTFEKDVDYYNKQLSKYQKKIQIKFTSDQKIQSKELEGFDVLEEPEIFNNMDQIHNLSWQGYYDQNNKKDGKWIAFWNQKPLENVGGQSYINIYILYYQEGQKQRIWKDIFFNFSNEAQIFDIGEYYKDLIMGRWNYIYKEVKLQIFQKFLMVVDITTIKVKNKAIGLRQMKDILILKSHQKWWVDGILHIVDIMRRNINKFIRNIQIYNYSGGGSYDQEGNQKKIGKWVELYEKFNIDKEFTHYGGYNMNGQKVGIWVEMDTKNDEKRGEKRYAILQNKKQNTF